MNPVWAVRSSRASVSAAQKDGAVAGEVSAENLAYLCQAVYEDSGIVLDESKGYLIESRLTPVARREGLESLDRLCVALRNGGLHGSLRGKVVEATVTGFGRVSVGPVHGAAAR